MEGHDQTDLLGDTRSVNFQTCYQIISTLLYIETQSERALMLTRNNIQFWLDQILSLKKKKKSSQGIYCLLKIPHQVPGNSSTSAGWLQKYFHFNSATSWSCHVPSWLPGSGFVLSPSLCSVSDSLTTCSSGSAQVLGIGKNR